MVPPWFSSLLRVESYSRGPITVGNPEKTTSAVDLKRSWQAAPSPFGSEENNDGRYPAPASSHGQRSLSAKPTIWLRQCLFINKPRPLGRVSASPEATLSRRLE